MKLLSSMIALGASSSLLGVSTAAYTELEGAGTTNPSKYLWKILDTFESQIRGSASLGYRAVGSSTGQKELTGQSPDYLPLNDFGAGDIPITTERYDQINSVGRSVAHFPFVMGAIAVFYNGGDGTIPNDVRLDACTLAKVFSGQITNWNDSEIAALNEGVTLPDLDITIVHRTLGSSSTAGFTEYIVKATDADGCSSSWGQGSGSTIDWFTGSVAAEGSAGVTAAIKATPGAIGYLDAGHGYSESLDEIALRNEDGAYLVANEAEIAAAGAVAVATNIIPGNATDSFADVNLYNLKGLTTWPITLISYLYVDVNSTALAAQEATYLDRLPLLVALLEYINSDDGQALAEDPAFGFTPIPQEIRDLNAATIELIKTNNDGKTEDWMIFEKSTQAYVGAGPNVISSKRNSWPILQRDANAAAIGEVGEDDPSLATDIAALQARIEALELANGETANSAHQVAASAVVLAAAAATTLFANCA